MVNRVKQFFLYFNYKIDENDREFVYKYLNKEQIELFEKLKVYEQKHCINVARDLVNHCKELNINYNDELIVAALLHDIGKIECSLNLIDKSALVILDKISRGKIKKYEKNKKVDIYYNHPEKGYNILKKMGEKNRILFLVKNHHNNDISNDLELSILKECDENN
ncbi:HDIG domain-containing metalloprotein [Haloimpatiens lingqiaonensis]|uniref:HDIG domain-containing metalloprotein n=1 Tax=Haloimpatiens lingqiaonensis TaxID=1380675 RepID=UPI0010FF0A46|nr:HD domain-containing protein [Haloimpatiens lingqiaonensis]